VQPPIFNAIKSVGGGLRHGVTRRITIQYSSDERIEIWGLGKGWDSRRVVLLLMGGFRWRGDGVFITQEFWGAGAIPRVGGRSQGLEKSWSGNNWGEGVPSQF